MGSAGEVHGEDDGAGSGELGEPDVAVEADRAHVGGGDGQVHPAGAAPSQRVGQRADQPLAVAARLQPGDQVDVQVRRVPAGQLARSDPGVMDEVRLGLLGGPPVLGNAGRGLSVLGAQLRPPIRLNSRRHRTIHIQATRTPPPPTRSPATPPGPRSDQPHPLTCALA